MKLNTKRIFFERIRVIYLPIVLYHLWRGHEVNTFDFTHDMKKSWSLKHLVNNDKIKRIYIGDLSPVHSLSIDQTEIVFERLAGIGKTLRNTIAEAFGTESVSLIFKKVLLAEIFKCLYINKHLSHVESQAHNGKRLRFYPDCYSTYAKMLTRLGEHKLNPLTKFRESKIFAAVSTLAVAWDNFNYWIVRWLYLMTKLLLGAINPITKKSSAQPQQYKYAIAIDQVFQVTLKGRRYFDFLLDGKILTPENSIFVFSIPVDQSVRRYCQTKGYAYVDLVRRNRLGGMLATKFSCGFIGKYLKAMLKIACPSRGPFAFTSAAIQSMNTLIEQEQAATIFTCQHYIYTNQENPRQLTVNILARRRGVTTWNYSLFIGGGFIHTTSDNFSNKRHIIWAYLNSDHFLAATNDAITYNRLHYQQIGECHDIGCIFSQLVAEANIDPGKKKLALSYFDSRYDESKKIVSFFDTTFINSDLCHTTFDDAAAFYRDVLRILDEFEDVLVMIKPAKPQDNFINPNHQWFCRQKGPKVVDLWDKLKNHSRVHWAGRCADSSAVIAASDLVVTHCMSSPTFEALGARKRAIWYESGQKHRGVLYDAIPGLVAHGYRELEQRLRKLLWQTSDDEYNDYLDREIKGKVESYMDSQALTRFRKLLTERKNNE